MNISIKNFIQLLRDTLKRFQLKQKNMNRKNNIYKNSSSYVIKLKL